jgi:hypothetical protein
VAVAVAVARGLFGNPEEAIKRILMDSNSACVCVCVCARVCSHELRIKEPNKSDYQSKPCVPSFLTLFLNPGQPRTLLQLKLVAILTINFRNRIYYFNN